MRRCSKAERCVVRHRCDELKEQVELCTHLATGAKLDVDESVISKVQAEMSASVEVSGPLATDQPFCLRYAQQSATRKQGHGNSLAIPGRHNNPSLPRAALTT